MDWPIGQPGYWTFKFSKNGSEDQMGSSASGVRYTKSSNQSILNSSGRDPMKSNASGHFKIDSAQKDFSYAPECSGGFPEVQEDH